MVSKLYIFGTTVNISACGLSYRTYFTDLAPARYNDSGPLCVYRLKTKYSEAKSMP